MPTGTSACTASASSPSTSPPEGPAEVAPTSTWRCASSTTFTKPSLPALWIQPRADVGTSVDADSHRQPGRAGVCLGHPYRADLGVGEGDPGQGSVVGRAHLLVVEAGLGQDSATTSRDWYIETWVKAP